jgi:hypothetical protein
MRRSALGFVARTGAAVAVAVRPGEIAGKWDLALAPDGVERFVYHAAQGLGEGAEAAVRDATRAIAKQAARSIDTLLAGLEDEIVGAAVVGKSLEMPAPLARILASHTLLHTAEGVLYRTVIVDALQDAGISCSLVTPDELGAYRPALDGFGKVPPPWRREHKDAALAALSLVRTDGRDRAPRTGHAARSRRRA